MHLLYAYLLEYQQYGWIFAESVLDDSASLNWE